MDNNQSIAEGNLLGMYTHDAERCDAGQPCAMCQWASEQAPSPSELCCTECAFEDDWERAPATVKRLVERNDAFYWWRQGRQSVKGVGQ